MSVKALFLLMIVGWSSMLLVSGSVKAQNIATSEAVAAPNDGETHLGPAQQLAKALLRNDLDGAQKYVEKDFVQIPEINENSPIGGIQLVSSPEKDVKILLAHFDDEVLKGERLAFIWELTEKGDRIIKIRVLFAGANPLVDEARLIREYQKKFIRHVLVPTEFPFKITQFDGYVDSNESLELVYRNDALNGFFRVKASPIAVELERYKGKDDVYYMLKDGTKALYRPKFELNFDSRRTGCNIRLRLETRKC
ncbi:hypothetical protein [Cohnella phaseoli]|uniref:Uncharacterized protein n=1 Tax=Cohnella phaseoli TaxID=456490 RepID=A0A3D9JQ24_9BACL|nr:hypothetical protein [Cohnella phaseoli]RED76060.1 hypothetical protein DFP98_113120 [Cohnella phaseoli]